MGRLTVLSQLDETFSASLAQHAGEVAIVSVPRGSPVDLPGEAEVFIAAPSRRAGGARNKCAARFAENLSRFRHGQPRADVIDFTRGY